MDSLALHFLMVVPCASVIKLEPQNLIDVSFCFSVPIRFATTTGILNDLHLRNQAANLRFYPWALLAISGLAIAIYQIKKA